MNDQGKTKEELIKELQELQQKNNWLKALCDKDNTERKQAKKELMIIGKIWKKSLQLTTTGLFWNWY